MRVIETHLREPIGVNGPLTAAVHIHCPSYSNNRLIQFLSHDYISMLTV